MFRPRANMTGFGIKKVKLVGSDKEVDAMSNDVPIGDVPLFEFINTNKQSLKYYDYMCPLCSIVLFYGEKN